VGAWALCLCFVVSDSYHDRWSVCFTSGGLPCITAEIEGKPYLLQVDLGNRFSLYFEKKVLEGLEKKLSGTAATRDVRGIRYKTAKYSLPKLKTGTFVWTNVEAREEHPDYKKNTTFFADPNNTPQFHVDGNIGQKILETHNLLMNFSHSVMFASNDFAKLDGEGYPVKKWCRVPLLSTKHGIYLDVRTEIGLKRFVLDTGATHSIVRSSEVEEEAGEEIKSFSFQKFEIGGRDFRNKTLLQFPMSPKLSDCNGIIGMDFLHDYAFYLDFKNEFAYFDFDHPLILRFPYHVKAGASFTMEKLPFIEVVIESVRYFMGIDFEVPFELTLSRRVLEGIKKYPTNQNAVHVIPKVQINGIDLADMRTTEDDSGTDGRCGWKLLRRFNWLIDYPQASIFMSNSLPHLEQAGYLIKNWVQVPFKTTPRGIVFEAETSFGMKSLLLNPGAPVTSIRAPEDQNGTSWIFKMGKKEFEITNIRFTTTVSEFDGVLGMDFLSRQPIYLDLIRDIAYFYQ